MTDQFRVLVIDDDAEVLNRLPQRLTSKPRLFEGKLYEVDVRPIHVEIEESEGNASRISASTLENLAAACADPPHLIFADFGYARKEVIGTLKKITEQGREITEQDLEGKALTTADLASAVKAFLAENTNDSYKRDSLRNNFLNVSANFYLYSYTALEFYKALGEVSARANRTGTSFPRCNVIPVDTKFEFYNGAEFDWPTRPSKHESRYYAHLVTGLINQLIQREFLEHILKDSRRLKYVRVQKSIVSVGGIMAIAGAIGATAEWLGAHILKLSTEGQIATALAFGGLTVIVLLIAGLLIPPLFERSMTGLLNKPDD